MWGHPPFKGIWFYVISSDLKKYHLKSKKKAWGFDLSVIVFRHIYRRNRKIDFLNFKLNVNLPFSYCHLRINKIIKTLMQKQCNSLHQTIKIITIITGIYVLYNISDFTKCFSIPLSHSVNYELAMKTFLFFWLIWKDFSWAWKNFSTFTVVRYWHGLLKRLWSHHYLWWWKQKYI